MKCNQVCPYNMLRGGTVLDSKGVCPLSTEELLGMSEQLVRTHDVLIRNGKKYEVVIADDNIFVVCPLKYSKKEKSVIVKYSIPEIYSNQTSINTLAELGFSKC